MNSLLLANLAQTANHRWAPGIGDPTLIGWFTVVCYFLVAYLCYRKAKETTKESGINGLTISWWLLTVVLVFLGINKQIDLQTLLTQIGRQLAIKQGWYANRRAVQKEFVLALAAGGFATLLLGAWILRRHIRKLRLAFIGLVLLIIYIVVRAASFHHADRFLGLRIAGFQMSWMLELGSLALIALGAYKRKR